MIRALLARVHAWTAPKPAPARPSLPPMRDGNELAPLGIVLAPSPVPGDPADLVLVRRTKEGLAVDGFVLAYPELSLLVSHAAALSDAMAKASRFYQPAELAPPVETPN